MQTTIKVHSQLTYSSNDRRYRACIHVERVLCFGHIETFLPSIFSCDKERKEPSPAKPTSDDRDWRWVGNSFCRSCVILSLVACHIPLDAHIVRALWRHQQSFHVKYDRLWQSETLHWSAPKKQTWTHHVSFNGTLEKIESWFVTLQSHNNSELITMPVLQWTWWFKTKKCLRPCHSHYKVSVVIIK